MGSLNSIPTITVLFILITLLSSGYISLTSLSLVLLTTSTLLILSIFVISIPITNKSTEKPISRRFPRLAFTRADQWVREVQELEEASEVSVKLKETGYAENVEGIIEFIIRDFVKGWFQSISKDDVTFPNEIKSQLNWIINNLDERIAGVDVSKLIILKILPILTVHFQNYNSAKEAVLDELKKNNHTAASLGLSELNFKIVKEFEDANGFNEFIELRSDDRENGMKNYSRDKINRILPYLIQKHELKSDIIGTLITELLSQVVLTPVLRMLADPDFWNGIIIKFATSILNDRDQVRELKKAIDKQTSKKNEDTHNKDNVTLQHKITKGKRVTLNMKYQEFQKYLKYIGSIENLSQLKQLRFLIALQINRTQVLNIEKSDKFVKYCQRLELAKDTIEKRILEISAETHPNVSILQKRNSLIFSQENDLEEFILNLSLFQVLKNPSALPFFKEFMEQRERADLLKFWVSVDQIKDPLEDPRVDDDDDFSFEGDEIVSSDVSLKDVEEIKSIFSNFFKCEKLDIDKVIFNQVNEFCQSDGIDVEEYNKIRKLIIFLQIKTFKKMELYDFKDFKNSDLFLKLLSNETFEESLVSGVDNLEDYNDDKGGYRTDSDDDSDAQGSEIYQDNDDGQSLVEIENALNTILTKPDFSSYSSTSETLTSSNNNNKSTDKLKNELFGGDSNDGFLTGDDLFKDNEEDNNTLQAEISNNDDIIGDALEIQNDFIKPTHDAFNLKEEINKLDSEISKLSKQSSIIDPLILKAELMNNSQELRLLRKSKSSYQREIGSKELIRQQLVVQDNENSLFGKTKVNINSWVKGKDERSGSVFIVYLIEIEKDNGKGIMTDDDSKKTTWVVGRRFSQFWKLNEHLKKSIGSSNDLVSFPKKKIILKFQERSIIDERRFQLEKYLNLLLKNAEVCQDKEFRKFLTLEDYHENSIPSSLTSTSTIKDTANKLYNGIYSGIDLLSSSRSGSRNQDKKDDYNRMSRSLDLNDDNYVDSDSSSTALPSPQLNMSGSFIAASGSNVTTSTNTSFVKPIIELFTVLFPLSSQSNNWLRGQAIVLILQQILGSTIEKHLKVMIDQATSIDKINDLIMLLKGILWPQGVFFKKGNQNKEEELNEREKMKLKIKNFQSSKKLLGELMNDIFGKVVGVKSCEVTSAKIHGMLQIDALNLELFVKVLDVILGDVFKEATSTGV